MMNKEKKFDLSKNELFSVRKKKEQNKEVAYNRLDYDGYRWWNTWFKVNGTGGRTEVSDEMQSFSDYLTDELLKKGLADIPAVVNTFGLDTVNGEPEYNLFCSATYCDFWVRLINRRRDYNMYVHCYIK